MKRSILLCQGVHARAGLGPGVEATVDDVGEVALDRGEIIAGGRSQPMHELEIELKGGAASDLHAVQKSMMRQLPAVPENRSKFARGIALLTGTDVDETRLEKDQV